MQFHQNKLIGKELIVLTCTLLILTSDLFSQVNTVEFGKNRVQYRKFKWKYIQTDNFNSYYYENGETIAKYVAQIAEQELPEVEKFVE